MDVQTITEDPEVAKRKLAAVREQLQRRTDAEYEALEAGYEAILAGKPLINLQQAINSAGLGQDGRPLLAVARADRKQVYVEAGRNKTVIFSAQKTPARWAAQSYTGTLRIILKTRWESASRDGYALVPMIPAEHRPNGSLTNFFILWEVEEWFSSPLIAEPPRDPLLIRPLTGDLYVVEAAWDLTDLERAVMSGRANQ